MRTFSSDTNDGTLLITTKIDRPMQGTLVAIDADGNKIIGKGIIRPPIVTTDMVEEDEALVEDAAFKKSFIGCTDFSFYPLNALSDQSCHLNRQAIYFACKDPAAFIRKDNERFNDLSAFDFISKESSKKIKAGLSPSLLIETAAVWNMFEKFEVKGIRSLAIASELVPDGATYGLSQEEKLEMAFTEHKYVPSFMLMVDTAKSLSKKIGCSINELVGKYWLMHRDPSLPTAETLVPMLCVGIASWKTNGKSEGIVFHPANPYWLAMGGDFDGDYAVCIQPTEVLRPRGSISRVGYKMKGKKYDSDNILDRIIQDAEESVTTLLGPTILAVTKLVERGLDSDNLRSIGASVAQGSIEAKKHVVDNDAIMANSSYIFEAANAGSENGTYPYITDLLNELSNTKSYELKVDVWNKFMKFLPYWEARGTELEKALCDRARKLNQLFADIEFFRHQARVKLPSFMVNAARNEASPVASSIARELAESYNIVARGLGNADDVTDDKESYIADIREHLKIISTRFQVFVTTGFCNGTKVNPIDAQIATVAYGPARIAARMVSSEVFEGLGKKTKRMISVLAGHNWVNGTVKVVDLNPIPSMKTELDKFVEDYEEVDITIIKQSPNSTRVMIEIIDS